MRPSGQLHPSRLSSATCTPPAFCQRARVRAGGSHGNDGDEGIRTDGGKLHCKRCPARQIACIGIMHESRGCKLHVTAGQGPGRATWPSPSGGITASHAVTHASCSLSDTARSSSCQRQEKLFRCNSLISLMLTVVSCVWHLTGAGAVVRVLRPAAGHQGSQRLAPVQRHRPPVPMRHLVARTPRLVSAAAVRERLGRGSDIKGQGRVWRWCLLRWRARWRVADLFHWWRCRAPEIRYPRKASRYPL